MKKITLCLIFLVFSMMGFAQFFTENFEAAPSAYTFDANQICNSSDYFARASNATINANGTNDYSNIEGTFYWAGESHDDIVNGNPGTCNTGNGQAAKELNFSVIDISGLSLSHIQFSARFGGNEISNSLEGDEYVRIEYSFDNVSFTTILNFTAVEIGAIDQLCLNGDNMDCIGQAMKTYTATFEKGSNSNLYIRVSGNNDSSSEEWAIDLIELTNLTVLPVELINFQAREKAGFVVLKWETLSEINNNYFEIEKSKNGIDFKSIGRLKGNQNSSTLRRYSFTDDAPNEGQNYYRLRQVDFDGGFQVSKTISAEINSGLHFSVFPNPTKDFIFLEFDKEIETPTVNIYNITGHLIQSDSFENIVGSVELNMSQMPSGTYFTEVISGNLRFWEKIVKH